MKILRKRTYRKVKHVLDFGDSNGLGWIKRKRYGKKSLVFKLFKSIFMHTI